MHKTSWMTSDILGRLNANAGMLLLRSLWEYCPEHMFIVRVEGPADFVIEAMNSTRQAMLGDETACIGKRIEQLLPPPMCHGVIANLHRCAECGSPIRYEEKGGYVDRHGACQQGHWQTLLVPITNQEGRVTHLFGVSRDMSQLPEQPVGASPESKEFERRVHERTAELVAANEHLTHLATHDCLTDTYNRRYLQELAELELRRASRYEQSLCLMMLDIDYFKKINDSEGHLAGDEALRCVAHTILATVRECDLVGRYGGDEFLILMPETTADGAREIAERLRRTLTQTSRFTVSIGIACLAPTDHFVVDLIHRADTMLLQAKRNGRNRIECAA
ncbi:diguanylate cyclase [Halomonas sp. MCCC 1A17488]|uniref:diguanylate cyclase n=1 Tax=Billgrantia sulfidoxydans TaxID=2733484 RepID=A0ABX7W3U9_9GAMM|nr:MULTISPECIES: sensor domain-containing diguanylate cyclase [Halomonas]MCE8015379.1 diguanylate cyclase [Halomonas sp. MCCC 1A17488]MCG3238712.1 diguanylate cyclase [Halomonas sp. MCCC 1A17488]QPP51317.1 diguanylate cyclase [Halomonas sp. SS10-MC5]QTP54873.1 diguanylate cyclase [Halomonas sulfidoxydans]